MDAASCAYVEASGGITCVVGHKVISPHERSVMGGLGVKTCGKTEIATGGVGATHGSAIQPASDVVIAAENNTPCATGDVDLTARYSACTAASGSPSRQGM